MSEQRVCANDQVLPDEQWNQLHDYLVLALDAIGERPAEFDAAFLRNCVMHQRLAIQLTHKRLEQIR